MPTMKRYITKWDDVNVVVDLAFISELLGISGEKARQLVKSGEIPAKKVSGLWRINKSDLMKYLGVAEPETPKNHIKEQELYEKITKIADYMINRLEQEDEK